jgi:hypothetical protein
MSSQINEGPDVALAVEFLDEEVAHDIAEVSGSTMNFRGDGVGLDKTRVKNDWNARLHSLFDAGVWSRMVR